MAGDRLRLSLRCDESAPRAVRDAMAALRCPGSVLGDAMLVASELVTNAVRHSLGTADDRLIVLIDTNRWLRIAVLDPGRSGRRAEVADRPGGRGGLGLKVVDQLARRWGARRREDGYQVWAELEIGD